ncbi:MAG: amidohydrolase family protein [Spirochaetaceae bacterium]|nr:MAG: amidohydrolase family protein [Spirochaetaceae bacterium]
MIVEGLSIFTHESIAVHIEGERIAAVRSLDGGKDLPLLAPGFLDMQVNGVLDSDYHLESFSADRIAEIVAYLDRSGTTQHVATIITSPKERILRSLRTLAGAVAADRNLERAIPAIHIEGPFISRLDGPRGAHDLTYVRPPDSEEAKQWQEAAEGRIRMITVSPEWEQAPAFIEAISEMGIVAAIGHTAATGEQIRDAVKAGARISTHLGNGSHTQVPRLRNYIWEQLAEDRLLAGIISDGFHLPDSVLKVFTRVKGPERLILVSDVAHLAGCKPGIHKRGNIDVQVFEDGHLGLPGTEILAGAGHLLDWDIPHFAAVTGLSLGEIIPLVTINPGRLLGLESEYGTLQPGAPANLTLFRRGAGSQPTAGSLPETGNLPLQILKTIRAGKVVYSPSR